MVNFEVVNSIQNIEDLKDDLPIGEPTQSNYIPNEIEISDDVLKVDTASINNNPSSPSSKSDFKSIKKALQNDHHNFIKNFQFYWGQYGGGEPLNGSWSGVTQALFNNGLLDGIDLPGDTHQCDGDMPDGWDSTDSTSETGGTENSGSTTNDTSSTNETMGDLFDSVDNMIDEINSIIDGFSADDFDFDQMIADQDKIMEYCNMLRTIAIILEGLYHSREMVAEELSGHKIESDRGFKKIVEGYVTNRVQMIQAQLMESITNYLDQLEADYDKKLAQIEEDHADDCDNMDKEEAIANATKEYEEKLEKLTSQMQSAFSKLYNSDISLSDIGSADEFKEEMNALANNIILSGFSTMSTTENGYYDPGVEKMEGIRSKLNDLHNMNRAITIALYTPLELRETVSRELQGKVGTVLNKDMTVSAEEETMAIQTSSLDTSMNLQLKLAQVHNEYNYHYLQWVKLDASYAARVWEWLNRAGAIVMSIFSIVCPYLMIGVVAANIAASLCNFAGQNEANNNIDDSFDLDVPDRVEEEENSDPSWVPQTSGQQSVLDGISDMGYIEGDDGLLYFDTTISAQLYGEMGAMQNIIRAQLLILEAKQDLRNTVKEELDGFPAASNNSTTVKNAYASQNAMYLFASQARTFVKDQIRFYTNTERMQQEQIDKAATNCWISIGASALGGILSIINPALGGIVGTLLGAAASIITSAVNNSWAMDYDQLHAGANFVDDTSINGSGSNHHDPEFPETELDVAEQDVLQDATALGFIETGTNGFSGPLGGAYFTVDPAQIIELRQKLAEIQNRRMGIITIRRALAEMRKAVHAEMTGKVGTMGKSYQTSTEAAVAQTRIIGQQLQHIINFVSQKAQLENRVTDAKKQLVQDIISGSISGGISIAGTILGAAVKGATDVIWAVANSVANFSSNLCQIIFSASDINESSNMLNEEDLTQRLIEGLRKTYSSGKDDNSIREAELNVLSQITTELIESMQGGLWGLNAGWKDYFASLMEKIFRIQEAQRKILQGIVEMKANVHQTFTGKPSVMLMDASSLLSAEETKAMSLVSDMFSYLEMIVTQHNRMAQAEKNLWLSIIESVATVAQSIAYTVSTANGEKADNLQKDMKDNPNLNTLKNNIELANFSKQSTKWYNIYLLMNICQTWNRVVVGNLIDLALSDKYAKNGPNIAVDATSDCEFAQMKKEAIEASLQKGQAELSRMNSAASFEKFQEFYQAAWQSLEDVSYLVAKLAKEKADQGFAVVDKANRQDYYNSCTSAGQNYLEIQEDLLDLLELLETVPRDSDQAQEIRDQITAKSNQLETMSTEMVELIEVAEENRVVEASRDTKGTPQIPIFDIHNVTPQFQQQVQSSTTALLAYADQLMAQMQPTDTTAPVSAQVIEECPETKQKRLEAQESLQSLKTTTDRMADSEIVFKGIATMEEAQSIDQVSNGETAKPETEEECLTNIRELRGQRSAILNDKTLTREQRAQSLQEVSKSLNLNIHHLRGFIRKRMSKANQGLGELQILNKVDREMDRLLAEHCNIEMTPPSESVVAPAGTAATEPAQSQRREEDSDSVSALVEDSLALRETIESSPALADLAQPIPVDNVMAEYIPEARSQSSDANFNALLNSIEASINAREAALNNEGIQPNEADIATRAGEVTLPETLEELRTLRREKLIERTNLQSEWQDNTQEIDSQIETLTAYTQTLQDLETQAAGVTQMLSNLMNQPAAEDEVIKLEALNTMIGQRIDHLEETSGLLRQSLEATTQRSLNIMGQIKDINADIQLIEAKMDDVRERISGIEITDEEPKTAQLNIDTQVSHKNPRRSILNDLMGGFSTWITPNSSANNGSTQARRVDTGRQTSIYNEREKAARAQEELTEKSFSA
ncbi:MAG: hypothetical protein KKB81_01740 [Candidatus Margulisbacteria bacterium]|nr:hypothetical protein [Candidatus Margulisiibacteriota bacterium]MBU1021638.1 hypothetical protein [Candidatus Margulisiibacteriota bacterium]MBU1728788.1 hypothetical protein [Candidatus Margulisiibacteriota bacterium]MBU1955754.1 hypothetical protein [Candidatus Margulisiibacteriota bacterium]